MIEGSVVRVLVKSGSSGDSLVIGSSNRYQSEVFSWCFNDVKCGELGHQSSQKWMMMDGDGWWMMDIHIIHIPTDVERFAAYAATCRAAAARKPLWHGEGTTWGTTQGGVMTCHPVKYQYFEHAQSCANGKNMFCHSHMYTVLLRMYSYCVYIYILNLFTHTYTFIVFLYLYKYMYLYCIFIRLFIYLFIYLYFKC